MPRPSSLSRIAVVAVAASLALPAFGCGLFRRRNQVNTSVSSSVSVTQTGRDLETLTRDEYEIVDTSIGEDKSTSFYVLTIPVGNQTTVEEMTENAYYRAVDRLPECDSLIMPRASVKRTVIPLLLVNIVIKKTLVKGRCAHLKGDREPVAKVEPSTSAPEATPSSEPEPPREPESAPPTADDAAPATQ